MNKAQWMISRTMYYQRYTLKKTTKFCVTETDDWWWGMQVHRYPSWMGLKIHLVLEELLCRLPRKGMLSVPVHIVHGWICDYNMREIVRYLMNRTDYVNGRG